jgi:cell division protein ZapE
MAEQSGVLAAYRALLAAGELRVDPEQQSAAEALDALARQMAVYDPSPPGLLARLVGRASDAPPSGIYLWGKVGRGKSMLMDLFYAQVVYPSKRRIHFHEFMVDVHARIHTYRSLDDAARRAAYGKEAGDDPMPALARVYASEARLLCFDEIQVSDVADAMILGRLFTGLFNQGVVVVATSNRPPDDLYKDGLNRQLFLPFIALIKDRLDVRSLGGPHDYRLDRLGGAPVYYAPNGPAATQALSNAFFRLTDHAVEDRAAVPSETLVVQGRELHVPKSLKGVAVFSFKRLCAAALGAADYLAIARRYHTVILVGIPRMGPNNRNEAKRFVTMIDALYEWKVKLLCSAEAKPQALYPEGDGAFEFERTVSRLMEMQSEAYLALGHGAPASV